MSQILVDYQAYQKGVTAERDRIIKLLEQGYFHDIMGEEIIIYAGEGPQRVIRHSSNCVTCTAIALIKGENK